MVKLKKPKASGIHDTLQNAIIAAINDPDYSFSLPRLSDWESVVSSSVDEKQRLEFVGDAVMHLSVALYLYRLFPDAAPGLYTNIRSAVNTNATFTHLMVKAGAYELPSRSRTTKVAADSFEVIVAALYLERGFADVCAWVQEQYAPLIGTARKSYDSFAISGRNNPLLSTKRHRGSLDPTSTPLLKKIRLSSRRSSPLSTLMARRVVKRMRSKGKVKLCLPTKKSKLPLEMRVHDREFRAAEPQRLPSVVIDLTMDDELDHEAAAPSNTTHVSRLISLSQQCTHSSQSDAIPRSGPNSCKDVVSLWPPRQGSTESQTSPHPSPRSLPTPASFPAVALPRRAISVVPQATVEYFKHPGISLPPQSDSVRAPSGSYGNPIVIDNSDTED